MTRFFVQRDPESCSRNLRRSTTRRPWRASAGSSEIFSIKHEASRRARASEPLEGAQERESRERSSDSGWARARTDRFDGHALCRLRPHAGYRASSRARVKLAASFVALARPLGRRSSSFSCAGQGDGVDRLRSALLLSRISRTTQNSYDSVKAAMTSTPAAPATSKLPRPAGRAPACGRARARGRTRAASTP